MDQGADIITQHTDSTAALQAAAERGVMAFGQASDMIKFAPKTQLTSIIDAWALTMLSAPKRFLMAPGNLLDTWHGILTVLW